MRLFTVKGVADTAPITLCMPVTRAAAVRAQSANSCHKRDVLVNTECPHPLFLAMKTSKRRGISATSESASDPVDPSGARNLSLLASRTA